VQKAEQMCKNSESVQKQRKTSNVENKWGKKWFQLKTLLHSYNFQQKKTSCALKRNIQTAFTERILITFAQF
jgi:hypothetical protein